MDEARRNLLAGAVGAGVGLPALAAALASPAEARPAVGKISYTWLWGPAQKIASGGGWKTVAWAHSPIPQDNDGYFDERRPSEVKLVQGGLYAMVVELAWQPHPKGVRYLRMVQSPYYFPIAQAPTVTGIDPDDLPTPVKGERPEAQHQVLAVQPAFAGTCRIQVWQNSGVPLELVRLPISAPSLMIARLGSI